MESPSEDRSRKAACIIIRYLLRKKAPVRIKELKSEFNNVNVDDLCAFCDNYPGNFERFNDGHGRCVKLVTKLSLCDTHCSKNTCSGQLPECTGLHVCKFYIMSKCQFAGTCAYGHDLTTSHNKQLLHQYLLDDAGPADICFLLTNSNSRSNVLIPRICKFYNTMTGCSKKTCENVTLHLCKHYVTGTCRFGLRCKRSHNMTDPAIQKLLTTYGIDTNRSPKEVLAVLKTMMSKEEDDGDSMDSLQSDRLGRMSLNDVNVTHRPGNRNQPGKISRAASACNLARTNPRNQEQESTGNIPLPDQGARPKTTIGSNRNIQGRMGRGISGSVPNLQHAVSIDKEMEQWICLYNLCGRCLFNNRCFNVHYPLPYQWVYRKKPGEPWIEFKAEKQNHELELTFCDPMNDNCFLDISDGIIWDVNFKTMTAKSGRYEVKRLSTKSSSDDERHPLATIWKWHWKDQMGNWKKYGDGDHGYQSTILSENIEQEYLAKPEGQMAFATQGHEYILDFQKMVQRNIHYKTSRPVSRRPEFMDQHTLDQKKRQANQRKKPPPNVMDTQQDIVPPNWSSVDVDLSDHCQLVQVVKRRSQREYSEIENLFFESMPNTFSITSIERVENGDLWLSYIGKQRKMKKRNPGKEVNELKLFHGTSSEFYQAICRQGFDFRLSGKSTGTLYGKGSYFAKTAKYSDAYAKSSERIIFVVRVLIGEYTKGESKFVRPPSKDRSNPCSDLYDSCVDSAENPKIFVIFDNSGQVYPEYVIKYTNTM